VLWNLFGIWILIFGASQCEAQGRQTLYRRYGRFFAEFLKDDSLVPLGLLALSTCVGFRYGAVYNNRRRFSRTHARSSWHRKPVPSRDAWIVHIEVIGAGFAKHLSSRPGCQTIKTHDLLSVVSPSIIYGGQEY